MTPSERAITAAGACHHARTVWGKDHVLCIPCAREAITEAEEAARTQERMRVANIIAGYFGGAVAVSKDLAERIRSRG